LKEILLLYLIAKAAISGIVIMAASEIAKRSPMFGALLVSLPLTSILAMIWLWRDTADNERTNRCAVASHLLVVVANASHVPRVAFSSTARG
jgi:hypothetical protein